MRLHGSLRDVAQNISIIINMLVFEVGFPSVYVKQRLSLLNKTFTERASMI